MGGRRRLPGAAQPAQGQLVNWWEGNVTMGPGGVLYAGNTGGAEYALNPNGKVTGTLRYQAEPTDVEAVAERRLARQDGRV